MPNFRDVWSSNESCHSQMGWETTLEGGNERGAKLKLKRLNSFFFPLWLINPKQKWIGLWEASLSVSWKFLGLGGRQLLSQGTRVLYDSCCVWLGPFPVTCPQRITAERWTGHVSPSALYCLVWLTHMFPLLWVTGLKAFLRFWALRTFWMVFLIEGSLSCSPLQYSLVLTLVCLVMSELGLNGDLNQTSDFRVGYKSEHLPFWIQRVIVWRRPCRYSQGLCTPQILLLLCFGSGDGGEHIILSEAMTRSRDFLKWMSNCLFIDGGVVPGTRV